MASPFRNAFDEKYVMYDIRDLHEQRYRKYEPERYKQTSASGGPLCLAALEPIARVMWEHEHPMMIPFSLTSLYCFLVCGDGPPSAFSLGFVPTDELRLDIAQWDTEFNFIDTIFLTHGWKIIDIWHQSDSLYLDIQLDLSAIEAVDGWVEQYTYTAIHRRRREPSLYGNVNSPNTFVLALTFRNVAPSLPYNWIVGDGTGQHVPEVTPLQIIADAQRRYDLHRSTLRPLRTPGSVVSDPSIHHRHCLALSLAATQPVGCVILAQTEEQESAGGEEGSKIDTATTANKSFMKMTDEEDIAVTLAQSMHEGGVHPPDGAAFHNAGSSHSSQTTLLSSHSDDSAQRQMSISRLQSIERKSRQFVADYITSRSHGGVKSALSSGYGTGESACEAAYLCRPSAQDIAGAPESTPHVQLAGSNMAENDEYISDSDSYRRPRHKQKDLANFLGITQKPLKPKTSQPPSPSENIPKEPRRKPKFLAGIFKGDDTPSSPSSTSTDDTSNPPRRLIKSRNSPEGHKQRPSAGSTTGSISGVSAFARGTKAGGSLDVAPAPVVVMESPHVGLARNSYGNNIKENIGNGGDTANSQPARNRTTSPVTEKSDFASVPSVTTTNTGYTSNAQMMNAKSTKSSPVTGSRNVTPATVIPPTDSAYTGTPIVKSPLVDVTDENTPTAGNSPRIPLTTDAAGGPVPQPFASHFMAARARVFSWWNQADDDYEASADNDDLEVARKADEEKARAMKNRYQGA